MASEYKDILYEVRDGVVRITINRPEVYNAFRNQTLEELIDALHRADEERSANVMVLTGAGDKAFCTGGDLKEAAQPGGYSKEMDLWHSRLHDVIRSIPKPVIAAVNGFAIGGGNIIQVICDLSIASETAKVGQAGPRVGSYDAGFGAVYLARCVGEKKAREIWFLCRMYTAQEALEMGMVNKVVPPDKLEAEVDAWCQEILALSTTALKMLKAAFNADTDHQMGIETLAMGSVRMFWASEEAVEYKHAFAEKRKADLSKFMK